MPEQPAPRKTPLDALHERLGANLVAFAGWRMPLHYPAGILAEHLHTRAAASLFDVSHMGTIAVRGGDAAQRLETLIPADLAGLAPGRLRYAVLTSDEGGVVDDLLARRADDGFRLVVNASRADADLAWLRERLPGADVEPVEGRALLALQGPRAEAALARHAPGAARLASHAAADMEVAGVPCEVSRSGYTGEDGFEIGCAAGDAERLADALLAGPEVEPAGLGARDSLRLEAGLCLWGSELDERTSPVEAGLAWTFGRWRDGGPDVPGAARIRAELAGGPPRVRAGLRLEGRAIARAGAPVAAPDGRPAGIVTSGGFGPTAGGPVAMAYLEPAAAAPGARLAAEVRGRAAPARVVPLPFVPHRRRRAAPPRNGEPA